MDVAHRLAQIGMFLLALAMVGVVLLIFDVVLGSTQGIVAAGIVAAVLVGLWVVLPLAIREQQDSDS